MANQDGMGRGVQVRGQVGEGEAPKKATPFAAVRSRLFFRIYAACMAACMLCIAMVSIVLVSAELRRSERDFEQKLTEDIEEIAYLVAQSPYMVTPQFGRWVTKFVEAYSGQLYVFSINGMLINATMGDSTLTPEQQAAQFEKYSDLAELAIHTKQNQIVREPSGEWNSRRGVLIAMPMADNALGQSTGAVLARVDGVSFSDAYAQALRPIGWAGLAALVVAFIISMAMSKKLTKPLEQMNRVVQRIAGGNFDQKVGMQARLDEIGQLGQAIDGMAAELAGLETLRRDFVANVSHELRSPLTSIQGFVQGVVDGAIDQAEQKHYLEVVLSETKRMNKLITDLLDLSRIESGRLIIVPAPFDINEAIRRVLISFEGRITQKAIQVDVHFSQERLMVLADMSRIEQVLVNLVDNAVKFLPEGGTLSLWTRSGGERVTVVVQDNGCGIASDDLPYLFERFYKSDKAHTRKDGTGLGLAIVKLILQQHGQHIAVTSRVGQGTTFTFTLAQDSVAQ